jgi:ABC-type sugar transport system substrate-binding protein
MPLPFATRRRDQLTALLATGALIAAATGCSSSPANGEARQLKTITMINPAPGVEAWQTVARCFQDQAEKRGVTAKVIGSSGSRQDARQTLGLVEQAVAEGTDAIILLTAGGEAVLESALAQAKSKGVLIATMESGSATKARHFDVGIDIPQFAKDVAAQIAKSPGPKNVGVLSVGLTGTPKSFNETLATSLAAVPDAKLVDIVTDNGDVTKDADLANNLLSAHPEINIIVTNAPGMMPGVETAIRERGALGEVSALALSFDDSTKAALESGAAAGVYIQRLCDVGTLGVDNFVDLAAGKKVLENIPVKAQFATKADYKTFDQDWN